MESLFPTIGRSCDRVGYVFTNFIPIISFWSNATFLGGLISHGAVVAREYGLPCVVGAEGATKVFKSGDVVVIDGAKGIVTKFENQK